MNKDKLGIKAILEAISKIEKYTKKHSNPDEFYNDSISFEASMMNFIVIGEMVTKISEEFKNVNPQISSLVSFKFIFDYLIRHNLIPLFFFLIII